MTSFSVDTAVGVVTALTGLIAASVATTQLSYRHRMMRTATWAQEQIPSAAGERKRHLEDMQRWAQSEVVAATMIPSKVFVEPLCVAAVFMMTPVLHHQSILWFAPTAILAQTFQYQRTIRLYCLNEYIDHAVVNC